MILSLLYVLIFAVSGIYIAEAILPTQKTAKRIWLGLVIGLFLWIWLPSLFAFAIGFTLKAQWLALAVSVAAGITAALKVKGRISGWKHIGKQLTLWPLLLLTGIFVLGVFLFSSHIIRPNEQGLSVGQVTYGDLSMHLGFITSIAEQGTFPPEYSIFPGQTINYPFLCETPASTLLLLGSSLRQAYQISAIYAYLLVIVGVFFFFEQWLRRMGSTVLAVLLFFFGSGFGFTYFFDRINADTTTLQQLLGTTSVNNWQALLDGFYQTPTNIPDLGLRWVNPIVDMLIPQRATLFGWAILFPCLYLLFGFAFRNEKKNVILLGFLAGGLPLIHTHSFLALGIISAGYFVSELFSRPPLKRITGWLSYGGIAVLLALPQLIFFTFTQMANSQMLRLHFNWGNTVDGFLWFYLKNLGWIALFIVPAYLLVSRRDRRAMTGPILLWLIAEFVMFQPNVYDNNKILFISFAFMCGLIARFVSSGYRRLSHYLQKKTTLEDSGRTYATAAALIALCHLAYWLFILISQKDATIEISFSTVLTLLFSLFTLLWLLAKNTIDQLKTSRTLLLCYVSLVSMLLAGSILLSLFFNQYQSKAISMGTGYVIGLLLLSAFTLLAQILVIIKTKRPTGRSARLAKLALSLSLSFIAMTTFIGSALTIAREARSEYLAFNKSEVEATDYITRETNAQSLFLTDANWHLNPVASLTGRNIVCGTDTFLFFHGIDAKERRLDVKKMLEAPANNQDLYESYGVDYVYIGQHERERYDLDTNFFDATWTSVFTNADVTIYQVKVR
ncbi:MAG TPA: hypothetical protein GXZ89_00485 [Fastidiosipila sp.]|nr:hypothetical protein [Fastidiosipila sp.]